MLDTEYFKDTIIKGMIKGAMYGPFLVGLSSVLCLGVAGGMGKLSNLGITKRAMIGALAGVPMGLACGGVVAAPYDLVQSYTKSAYELAKPSLPESVSDAIEECPEFLVNALHGGLVGLIIWCISVGGPAAHNTLYGIKSYVLVGSAFSAVGGMGTSPLFDAAYHVYSFGVESAMNLISGAVTHEENEL